MITQPKHIFITGFHVSDLFGYLTHDFSPSPKRDISRLGILYGANGTGKTRLLQLIYHTLGANARGGHRGRIASIPFTRFEVWLSNGYSLCCRRDKAVSGPYAYQLCRPDGSILEAPYSPGNIPHDPLDIVVEQLALFAPGLIFVPANRSVAFDMSSQSQHMSPDMRFFEHSLTRNERISHDLFEHPSESREQEDLQAEAEAAVAALHGWIQSRIARYSHQGETSAQTAYVNILKHIASPITHTKATLDPLPTLIKRLYALETDSKALERYGLATAIDATAIERLITNTPQNRKTLLRNTLNAYIESINARFARLLEVHRLIDVFVTSLQIYFDSKSVSYNAKEGLIIQTPKGVNIAPGSLSSGERQLLFLLACTVVASEVPTTIIIDEPEISLNIDWQRSIISTLLELTKDAPVQFLIASHSFQLSTPYREQILTLEAPQRRLK